MALQIESVDKDSNAEAAGLLVGDIILSVNERKVETVNELIEALTAEGSATVNFVRLGKDMSVALQAGKLGCWMVPVAEPDKSYTNAPDRKMPDLTVNEWKFKTQYGMNQVISTICMLLGWLMVFGGAGFLFIKGADFAAVSLTLSALGLAVVQLSQISRAITDTADHTREVMNLLADQIRK